MMHDHSALRLAFELLHAPWQARRLRTEPVPDGTYFLLRIAAGDEKVIGEAVEASGRSRQVVIEAAEFFVEQALLYSDADAYRVLGVRPDATSSVLRRNMALLLKWLHPDLDRQGERRIFAARVTNAWNNLKTSSRREAYDRMRRTAFTKTSATGKHRKQNLRRVKALRKRTVPHRQSVGSINFREASKGLLRRLSLFLLGRAAH